MPDDNRRVLEEECRTLVRHVLGGTAPAAVVSAYCRAHDVHANLVRPVHGQDRAALVLARTGAAGARFADAYAALFLRSGLLRRKLVLILAILESRGETARMIDTAIPGSKLSWGGGMLLHGVAALGRVVCAALLIAPLSLWYRSGRRS